MTEDDVCDFLNKKMLGCSEEKPGVFWGECAAISDQWGHNKNKYSIASLYWHKEPPPASIVKQWFEECGVVVHSINRVLWCDDGCAEEDKAGVVHWEVSFGS